MTAPDRLLAPGYGAWIEDMLSTTRIAVGRTDSAWIDSAWCYHTRAGAEAALAAWDGTGEPDGWHRHPMSDRRRYRCLACSQNVEVVGTTPVPCPTCGAPYEESRGIDR